MLVAITGAAGHIGANLIRELLARGVRVRALVHSDRRALAGLEVEEARADLHDASSLERAFAGAERVFHLAARISIAPGDEREVHSINVDGTRNVVDACRRAGVRRLIHFSSIHAFASRPVDRAIDEQRPLADDRALPYDRSKAAGERLVRDAAARGLDAIVLNPTAVLGPHDYGPSAMGQVLLDLYHGRLPALIEGGFDWVDVRDVVEGALVAADRAPAGARYLLGGERRSVRELATLCARITGRPAPRLTSPMWLARIGAPFATAAARLRGTRPLFTSASLHALRNHRLVNHERAARELGYRARPLEDTVEAAYGWFRDSGALA
jgi:dihydroflavonol-4-reductase